VIACSGDIFLVTPPFSSEEIRPSASHIGVTTQNTDVCIIRKYEHFAVLSLRSSFGVFEVSGLIELFPPDKPQSCPVYCAVCRSHQAPQFS
jgi:hypothetical protein